MTDVAVLAPAFTLGRISFTVSAAEEEFLRRLAALIPAAGEMPEPLPEIAAQGEVRVVLNDALRLHAGFRWIHAACLVNPAGGPVLLAGQSGAGKTTTALALALAYGWKVLADDITLIDPQTNRIVGFPAPFSLKPPTSELLAASMGITLPRPELGEWVPMGKLFAAEEPEAEFVLACFLAPAGRGNPLAVSRCSPAEYTRLLLPWSSVLHDDGGPERFAGRMASSRCYRIAGGSIAQRVESIMHLASELP